MIFACGAQMYQVKFTVRLISVKLFSDYFECQTIVEDFHQFDCLLTCCVNELEFLIELILLL